MFWNRSGAKAALAFTFAMTAGLLLYGWTSVKADNAYCAVTTTTAFLQDWSNAGLITVDDDWSGVPCINGYRGDDASAAAGVNPATILTDLSSILDVNANRNDPNTFATGGVTEFDGIANPTAALKGSGTADFPHLIIRINSTGCTGQAKLTFTYNVRDLDSTATDATQMAALHYRIGSTGNFTNLNAGFVADATNPNTATRVSPIYVSLPEEAKGVPQLQLRVMTSNANGTDEAIGIDDIRVGCAVLTASSVSISGRVTTSDGRGLGRVAVTVAGGSLERPRYAITNAFGYYTIDSLEAGGTYVVSVSSKRYVFDTPERVIQLLDSVDNADFVAEP